MTLRLNKATVAQLATELEVAMAEGGELENQFGDAWDAAPDPDVKARWRRSAAEKAVNLVIDRLKRTGLVVVVEDGENAAQVTDPKVVSGFVTGFLDAPSTASPHRRDYLTSFHLEQEHLFPDVQDDE